MRSSHVQGFGIALVCCGLLTLALGLWLLLQPAYFQAVATIRIEPDRIKSEQASYDEDFLQIEFEAIQSENVLGKVAQSLNLESKRTETANGKFVEVKAIQRLRRQMKLHPMRNKRFIEIQFTDGDATTAAKVANAIAEAYHHYRIEQRMQLTTQAIRTLEAEYSKCEQKIKAAQEGLEHLRKQVNVTKEEERFQEESFRYGTNSTIQIDAKRRKELAPYFDAQRKLKELIEFRRILEMKVTSDKIDLPTPKTAFIEIIDLAVPPQQPAGPNRYLGGALLGIGVLSATSGLWLIQTSRRVRNP